MQKEPAKAAKYYLLEAQNLLQSKKRSNRTREVYALLLDKYIFHIPLDTVIEQLRELANDYDNGRGTFLGISDEEMSIRIYRVIVKYQPTISKSLNDRLVLAKKLVDNEEYHEAVQVYQDIIKLVPADADARFGLAKVLLVLAHENDGDGQRTAAAIREARAFLELSSASDPRRSEAEVIIKDGQDIQAARLLELGKFYLVKYHYRPAVARRYLHDLIRDYPNSSSVAEAKKIIAEKFPEQTTEQTTEQK